MIAYRPSVSDVAWWVGTAVVIAAIMLGWWGPNFTDWTRCGADTTFSATRAIFKSPDGLDCLRARAVNG